MEAKATCQTNIRPAEIARARRVKRINAITALLIGSILMALILKLVRFDSRQWDPLHLVGGLLGGILYANSFEYILHRFFLHSGQGFLVQRHGLHHHTAERRKNRATSISPPRIGWCCWCSY